MPHMERTRSQQAVVGSPQQVTSNTEEILNESVHRQEALRVSGRLEAPHLALTLSGRLMRDLRSIVLVLLGAVDNGRHDGSVGSCVAAKLVGDHPSRLTALSTGAVLAAVLVGAGAAAAKVNVAATANEQRIKCLVIAESLLADAMMQELFNGIWNCPRITRITRMKGR